FHLDVRNHLAADFAEPAQAVSDADEPVFIDGGDVARVVPAVLQDLSRLFRLLQVPLHDVGPADEQQTRLSDGHRLASSGVHDPHTSSRQGGTDAATL